MDLKQARILLDKINALYKSISLDDGKMASIERDLMLNYIRQLYEAFLEQEGDARISRPEPPRHRESPEPKAPEPTPHKQVPQEQPELKKETAPVRPEPKPTEEPEAKNEPEKTVEAPKPEKLPDPGKKPTNAQLEALFQFGQAKELSEKLSERPIEDLSKAMTINDRLLFQNDLFHKDQEAFQESVKLLNKFNSMDEAKSLLINLADQYTWTNEERVETARSFVKMVRRRYI